jgi:hypothetical protein
VGRHTASPEEGRKVEKKKTKKEKVGGKEDKPN